MQLELEDIGQRVGSETHLYPQSLSLQSSVVNVLLGATQAGKTSLMRIMAGLDQPSQGRVLVDGVDVTGVPVRKRNVAMVYQQFINYPAMTVSENIASPLRLRGERKELIAQRVQELAQRLHIEMFLDRLPAELSGGQQQRVAWTPTGTNVPDYPKLAQLWWKNVAQAVTGEKTPQGAMDNLAEEMDKVMGRLERSGMARCAPKLNPKSKPEKWLSNDHAPWAKLSNEKPQGKTIAYQTLLDAWKAGKVR
jgi:ABC-type uncharacterized transport system YnjBCD ATPase subunit